MRDAQPVGERDRIAVVGAGVMGEAFIRGLLRAGVARSEDLVAADKSEARRLHMQKTYGVAVTHDNAQALREADVAIVAVKPQHLVEALTELAQAVQPHRHLVLSVVAGVSTRVLESFLPHGTPVVRAMPNTAAWVGQAATGLCAGSFATEVHRHKATRLVGAIGRAVWVAEELMDAVTGLSGSGPAYACLVLEALTEGGIAAGLPRDQALVLAACTLLGTAQMVLETGRHPAELRQQVTSPAGTTAAGLLSLERRAVRAAFVEAVLEATRRARELGEAVQAQLEQRVGGQPQATPARSGE